MRKTISCCFLVAGMLGSAGAAVAETALAEAGCEHTIESVPTTVQQILAPALAENSTVDLKAVAHQLDILMLEAGHCQAVTQSHEYTGANKYHELTEWQSLNQWLYRLANFVDLNARGDHSIDWREEYEVFAEVYQLSK